MIVSFCSVIADFDIKIYGTPTSDRPLPGSKDVDTGWEVNRIFTSISDYEAPTSNESCCLPAAVYPKILEEIRHCRIYCTGEIDPFFLCSTPP